LHLIEVLLQAAALTTGLTLVAGYLGIKFLYENRYDEIPESVWSKDR